jgi:hypothetical protein
MKSHRKQKAELKKITLSPAEVTAVFGIPEGTLANLRWTKKGPRYFRRPGGRGILYLVSDVETWVTSCPVQTLESIEAERERT